MTNPQLIIMRGISGSGKSTLAKSLLDRYQNTIIVSRDDLRISFYNKDFGPPIDEDFITDVENYTIGAALAQSVGVISDNTNLTERAIWEKVRLGLIHHAEIHLREVEIPLHLAKYRNRERSSLGGRFVPEEVIDKQHSNFYEYQDAVQALVSRYSHTDDL